MEKPILILLGLVLTTLGVWAWVLMWKATPTQQPIRWWELLIVAVWLGLPIVGVGLTIKGMEQ
jgi:CHASE1-domain containing sensor protein